MTGSATLPMLIVSGNTLADAIATNNALPIGTALAVAKHDYQAKTGKVATHLWLTAYDAQQLAQHPDILDMLKYVNSAYMLLCGLPPFLRGLQLAFLE